MEQEHIKWEIILNKVKDYVEERMQHIDELGNHFMKLEMYDDVRKADIEGR